MSRHGRRRAWSLHDVRAAQPARPALDAWVARSIRSCSEWTVLDIDAALTGPHGRVPVFVLSLPPLFRLAFAAPRALRRRPAAARRRFRASRSAGGDRLRPAAHRRPLLGQRQREHLRAAAHLRLPRAPGEARAAHRRGGAGAEERGHALHLPHQAGHPLRRRSRVQGREARARGARRGIRVKRFATREPQPPSSGSSRTRSWASTSWSRRRRRPASSTTTRRSPASRSATDTRISFKLKEPDYNFLYVLAHARRGAGGARGDRGDYADDTMRTPSAPGPFVLGDGCGARRSSSRRIRTIAATMDFKARAIRRTNARIVAEMGGKRLPRSTASRSTSWTRTSRASSRSSTRSTTS